MNNGLKTTAILLLTANNAIEQTTKTFKKAQRKRVRKVVSAVKKGRRKALNNLGIASLSDVDKLKNRVEELGTKIDGLSH